ncbi:MAG: hypothetical protein GXP59_05250 [Deltaproteobacteria bacterium]|nr:hypothetical protein [Deltaproteobacteria bacterium]
MQKPTITTNLAALASLYEEMQEAYEQTARLLDFSCHGCPDNCCDSYFLHHTYIEWAYLRVGLFKLTQKKRDKYLARAADYDKQCELDLAAGRRPEIMCPVNDKGRCGLYDHRLLICRLHGVPGGMTMPNGQQRSFPGCFRCQEITADRRNVTAMDRTLFFKKMLQLERKFTGPRPQAPPKVKMTLARMLLTPPPNF